MSTLSLAEAIESYRLHCRARGLAPRTTETYFSALEALSGFAAALGDANPPIPPSHQLRAFIASMLDRGLSRGTIRIRMRAIRAFCGFMVREGMVTANPFAGVEIPRVPYTMPEILSPTEVQQLLRAARGASWCGTRNCAMLMIFLDTGLRLGELIGLDIGDVDLAARTLRVRSGKWSKDRQVYTGQATAKAIRNWIEIRPRSQTATALFVTRAGDRLDKRNVGRIVERTAKRAGLGSRRVHPHLLRHTFATHYIMNGGDPFSLQRILGHSDIKTTMIYVNLAGVGLREAHAKASPVDALLRGR